MNGFIHSIQTLGATDGPGVRFTVFTNGCPLRCVCCHNPDTWEFGGTEMSADELIKKAERYREYFKVKGGITVSGGEPLCQAEFCKELFTISRCLFHFVDSFLCLQKLFSLMLSCLFTFAFSTIIIV